MKVDVISLGGSEAARTKAIAGVRGETERLRKVVLCPPAHLSAVPCCSVTRESLRNGFTPSLAIAEQQHAALRRALQGCGVTCHMLGAVPGLPDLCFTRDVAVTTPGD